MEPARASQIIDKAFESVSETLLLNIDRTSLIDAMTKFDDYYRLSKGEPGNEAYTAAQNSAESQMRSLIQDGITTFTKKGNTIVEPKIWTEIYLNALLEPIKKDADVLSPSPSPRTSPSQGR